MQRFCLLNMRTLQRAVVVHVPVPLNTNDFVPSISVTFCKQTHSVNIKNNNNWESTLALHSPCLQSLFLLLVSTSVSAVLSKPPWPCPHLLVFTFACHDSPDFYRTMWQPWKDSDSFGAESLETPCCVTVCKAPERPHTIRPSKVRVRNGNGETCVHKNFLIMCWSVWLEFKPNDCAQ